VMGRAFYAWHSCSPWRGFAHKPKVAPSRCKPCTHKRNHVARVVELGHGHGGHGVVVGGGLVEPLLTGVMTHGPGGGEEGWKRGGGGMTSSSKLPGNTMQAGSAHES
jgi:hypothetical protein